MIFIKFRYFYILCFLILMGCDSKDASTNSQAPKQDPIEKIELTEEQAINLARLPLHCMHQEFPYKLGQTLGSASDLGTPSELHPAFYGCFDWHSAVHGHWMLVKILKEFSEISIRDSIMTGLQKNITAENVLAEVAYFEPKTNKSFERTYGWSWLLKLALELHTWEDPIARKLEKNLQPLTDLMVEKYIDFLPKLKYPIRVGEHTNTAFGLTFPLEYATEVGNKELANLIKSRAKEFYFSDQNCPISWEPSGFDFLSPCLEEANLMRIVLDKKDFEKWFSEFLPDLSNPDFKLPEGEIIDRTDGKLVHLDGLNFSRAWCLYPIASQYPDYQHLRVIGNDHINKSLSNLAGDSYAGSHWLASFALQALAAQGEEAIGESE